MPNLKNLKDEFWKNVNWEEFLSDANTEGEPEVIGSSQSLPTTDSSTDSSSLPNVGINPSAARTFTDDTQSGGFTDSTTTGKEPLAGGRWDQVQPLNPWNIPNSSPFTLDPLSPLGLSTLSPFQQSPEYQRLEYPTVPYPNEYTQEVLKKEWENSEIIVFLETLGVIPEETMKKIKTVLKPIKPIVHNNRIDDLILDIEE